MSTTVKSLSSSYQEKLDQLFTAMADAAVNGPPIVESELLNRTFRVHQNVRATLKQSIETLDLTFHELIDLKHSSFDKGIDDAINGR